MHKFWVVLLVLLVAVPAAFASDAGDTRPLFAPAREVDIHVPAAERDGAQFLEMDRARFEALASRREFTCLIPNFPLASDGFGDLRVEQFDAVSKNIVGNYPVPDHVFLRGSVDGIPGSHVCLCIYRDCAWGYINANEKTYSVSAASRTEMGNLILGVILDTTRTDNFSCGLDDFHKSISPQLQRAIDASNNSQSIPEKTLATHVPQFPVAFEMDYPCVQHCGGTDTDAFKYGLSVLAVASDLYMRDAGMALVCCSHFEWTTKDDYVSDTACDLLDEFNGSNIPTNSTSPAMYVLFSGRPLNWCGGVARDIGVLCQGIYARCICGISNSLRKNGWDYPYHVWTWDAMVCTHETGHLVACYHTFNCYAYGTPLDSCVAPEGGWCYTTPVPSKGTIMSYCHTTPAGAILKFHPKCIQVIKNQIQSYTCMTDVALPQIAIAPSNQIQECAGGEYRFTCTASGSISPYTFEVNPPADSISINADASTVFLNPAKAQKFYIRLTDGESVRIYDSITFLPLGTFSVKVRMDSVGISRDSMVLIADMPDTSSITYSWFKLPSSIRSIGANQRLVVSRKTANQYYVRAATVGGCTAEDTVFVTAASSTFGVEQTAQPQLRIFPNPASQQITVVLPLGATHRYWIEDVIGRRIDVPSSQSVNTSDRIDFDISHLAPGTYWIAWEQQGVLQVASFVKQ